ncbi:MAG: hypothetical protein K8I82_12900, partial [Anaerolineae bacterium]|nr:hypothetical protein [Anaerolineae bacterium]
MTHRRASHITAEQKRRILMLAAVPFIGGLALAGVLLFVTSRLFDEASFYNDEGISAAEDGKYEEA